MKQLLLYSLLLLGIISEGMAQTYPPIIPGDTDFNIYYELGFIRLDVAGPGDKAWIVDCELGLNQNFRFNFPNPSPSGDHKTRAKIILYEQNYTTGAISTAFTSNWTEWPKSTASLHYYVMGLYGDYFTAKPGHRYYAQIKRKKKIGFIWVNASDGYTETRNVGKCENRCNEYSGLVLGVLNSSPANQAAGLYHPKYETDHAIVSTTPLANGEELILDARLEIRLKPGFHADYGSKFSAWIDGCGGRNSNSNTDEYYTDYETKGVHIKEDLSTEKSINLYPNPTNGITTINIENFSLEGNNYQAILYNSIGEELKAFSIEKPSTTVDLSNYSKGIYLIHVFNETNKKTIKFLKK